jgi:hypothetical protein
MAQLMNYEPVLSRPPTPYTPWFDAPVLLRVSSTRNQSLQSELHCSIVSESDASVHIHMGHREQNISKKLILAVEEIEKTPVHRRLQ